MQEDDNREADENQQQQQQLPQEDDSLDSIASDLAHVENRLSSTRRLPVGRAALESLSTQIGSIRRRVQELSNSRANTQPISAVASNSRHSEHSISQRLDQAELATERGVPLDVLRRQLERRQREGAQGEEKIEHAKTDIDMEDVSRHTYEKENQQQRRSALFASRARTEELTQMARDVELHESALDLSSLMGEGVEGVLPSLDEEPHMEVDCDIPPLGVGTEASDTMCDEEYPNSQANQSLGLGSVVYSWGNGLTTLHDDDEDKFLSEAKVSKNSRIVRYNISSVSTSATHTAVATSAGDVLACGSNQHGQVEPLRLSEPLIFKPSVLESLSMARVTQVACGLHHTAALTSTGSVLTWGSNAKGQLGHAQSATTTVTTGASAPQAMVLGAGRRAAQIACGNFFTLVLTTRMSVVACGCSEIVPSDSLVRLPTTIPALEAMPISSIAAGAEHAVVVTCHGTAYAWGANDVGCCGRAFPRCLTVPVPIMVPNAHAAQNLARPQPTTPQIQYLHDQLHSLHHSADWDGPAYQPITISDSVAIQEVACGDKHTILITRSGRLLVCGSNQHGQLGLPTLENVTELTMINEHPEVKFVKASAGTKHTIVLDSECNVWNMARPNGMEVILIGKNIAQIAAGGNQSIAVAAGPLPKKKREFSIQSSTSLDGLDLPKNSVDAILGKIAKGEDCKDLIGRMEELFRYPAVMNSLFLDPLECDTLYGRIVKDGTQENRQLVASAIENGMFKGLESLRGARLMYPEAVRCLLLYLQCPLFCDWRENDVLFDRRGDLIISLCETCLSLPFEGYRALTSWATASYPAGVFAPLLIRPLLAQLARGIASNGGAHARVIPKVVMILRWLHKAARRAGNIAKPEDFYSDAIDQLSPEILYEDLRRYRASSQSKQQKPSGFFLCANTFLISPTCKRNLLQIEHQVEMMKAATSNVVWDAQQRQFVFSPYFVLAVDREYLLQQTLHRVAAANPGDLRKSLKVVFKGEDGVDAGGVTKEFFQLLTTQLFDLNTGMWSMNVDDNITWFNADCTWNDDGYYLVGVLFGLALYNSTLLDVHFPGAVYRKLLGHPLGLEDMVDESVKAGLQQLLDYTGDDVEDIFCVSFEVTWMELGLERRVALKPGGANISVTSDNKEEYVLLYVKWLLVDSVKRQYEHFARGVMQVLESSSLDLLEPEELELLVVGSPDLDFAALEKNTEYEGGYDAESSAVKNFWHFVKNASPETQLQLLKFCTGTSKAPIGGLGAMPFKIQRAGPDSMQLPTSHTCFNTLLLPDYGDDKDKLERLLGRAILECEGFGLQ